VEKRTKVDANGTLIDFVTHDEGLCSRCSEEEVVESGRERAVEVDRSNETCGLR
jgi:predicted ABC-type transport system involved in lysophospholipase L1 biosynthesis ATPase subunit